MSCICGASSRRRRRKKKLSEKDATKILEKAQSDAVGVFNVSVKSGEAKLLMSWLLQPVDEQNLLSCTKFYKAALPVFEEIIRNLCKHQSEVLVRLMLKVKFSGGGGSEEEGVRAYRFTTDDTLVSTDEKLRELPEDFLCNMISDVEGRIFTHCRNSLRYSLSSLEIMLCR